MKFKNPSLLLVKMGVIRSGLLVLVVVSLSVFLIIGNSLFIFSSSLEYENIQEELLPVVEEVMGDAIDLPASVGIRSEMMSLYCENNSNFVFSEGEYTFDVSCDSILQGDDAVISEIVHEFAEEVYYKDYDCGFVGCLKEGREKPFFLISEGTKDYLEGKAYLVFFICLILSVLVFFLVETKTNAPVIVGVVVILSSLPFLKLESVLSFFADNSILKFFTFLFTQSYPVAISGIIAGVILILVGIVLKFFKLGFWVSDIIGKLSGRGSANPNPEGKNKPPVKQNPQTFRKKQG